MKITCHFHPTQPAYWSCPRCQQSHCQECVLRRAGNTPLSRANIYLCPICGGFSEFIGVTNVLEPFWQRLPKVFIYPLAPHALIFMVITALLSGLAVGFGFLGFLLASLTGLMVLKYAFAALRATAGGNLKAPAIGYETLTGDIKPVIKQYILYYAVGFLGFYVYAQWGSAAGVIYLTLAVLLLPAMVMIVVTTESLLQALNPFQFLRLALRIGGAYLLLFFFLSILISAPGALGYYIIRHLPETLHPYLYGLAQSYYTIVTYHLMGYVLLQYHDRIGFDVDYEDFMDPTGAKEPPLPLSWTQEVLHRVKLMAADGKLDEAIELIRETAGRDQIEDIDLSAQYLRLLKLRGQEAAHQRHAVRHLDLLVTAGRRQAACRLYHELAQANTKMGLPAAKLLKLADWMGEGEDPQTALNAYKQLVADNPDDRLVPKAYFHTAQIFHSRLLDTARAKKILKGLIHKYPNHEITPLAQNYLGNLEA